MGFEQNLQRLATKITEATKSLESLAAAKTCSLEYFRFLFIRNKQYLLWSFGLGWLQIIEVLLLAIYHYIYMPPESLQLLRLLSSFSLFGIIFAIIFRSFTFEQSVKETDRLALQGQARLLAYLLLLFGLGVAVVLSLKMIFYTHLHFTAPPIFRAVIICGVINLPLTLFSAFILYNLKAFNSPVLSMNLRMLFFLAKAAALIALVINSPAIYCTLTVLPQFIIAKHLWKLTTAGLNRSFLKLNYSDLSQNVAIRSLFQRSWPGILMFLASETSFYLVCHILSSYDANIAFALYLLQKLVHLAQIMSFKTNRSLSNQYLSAFYTKNIPGFTENTKRSLVAIFVYVTLALSFLPILYLKHETSAWTSPTGETVGLNWKICCALVIQLICRNLFTLSVSFGLFGMLKRRVIISACAYILGFSILIITASNTLINQFGIDAVFALILSLDSIVCLTVTYFCYFSLHTTLKDEQPVNAQDDFSFFLGILKSKRKYSNFLLIELSSARDSSGNLISTYLSVLFKEMVVLPWGQLAVLVLAPDNNDLLQIRKKILNSIGWACRDITAYSSQDSAINQFFLKNLKRTGLIKLFLSSHHKSNNPGWLRTAKHHLQFDSLGMTSNTLSNASARNDDYWQENGIEFFKVKGYAWNSKIADPDLIRKLDRYLLTIMHGEALSPRMQMLNKFKGLFHLNINGTPSILVYIPPQLRSSLLIYQAAAFCNNIWDACKHSDTSGFTDKSLSLFLANDEYSI